MFIADLAKLGFLPLQDHNKKQPLDQRITLYATRVVDIPQDSGYYVTEDGGQRTEGDILCASLWPAGNGQTPRQEAQSDLAQAQQITRERNAIEASMRVGATPGQGREIPGWAFAWPVKVIKGNDKKAAAGRSAQGGGTTTSTQANEERTAGDGVTVLPVKDKSWEVDKAFKPKKLGLATSH